MKTVKIIITLLLINISCLSSQTVNRLWSRETGFLMYLSIYQIDVGLPENVELMNYYQQSFDRQSYNKYRNNEFEWKSYCDRTIASIRRKVNAISFDTTYTFYSNCEFGTYNMEKESFPMIRFFNNGRFKLSTIYKQLPIFGNILNTIYLIDPINEFEFYDLEMDKITAQYFIQQRTSSSGSVNRTVYGRVKLKLIPVKNISTEENILSVLTHISSVEYYSDAKYTNSLIYVPSTLNLQQHLAQSPAGRWINEADPSDTLLIVKFNSVKTPYLINASTYRSELYQLSPCRFELKINHHWEVLLLQNNRMIIQSSNERKYYRRR